jgi:hypothetical protein
MTMFVPARAAIAVTSGQTWGVPGGVSVLVLRAPGGDAVLRQNGAALVPVKPPRCSESAAPGFAEQIRAGVSYADAHSGLVVRCTRGGRGHLSVDGRTLAPVLAEARTFAAARQARR